MNPICFPIAVIVVGGVVLLMAVFTLRYGIGDEFYAQSATEDKG